MTSRLWIDVEDLFEYAHRNPRPSGIQRLAFELCRALQEQYGSTGLIQFVRHENMRSGFMTVAWTDVAALFDRMTADVRKSAQFTREATPPRPASPLIRRFVLRLPLDVRVPLLDAIALQLKALRACGTMFRVLVRSLVHLPSAVAPRARRKTAAVNAQLPGGSASVATASFAQVVAPGDVLLALGASWTHPDYPGLLRDARIRHRVRVAALIYDLIPLRCPEWFDRRYQASVRSWFESIVPQCDILLTISQAVLRDVRDYAQRRGMTLPEKVQPIPIGTGFNVAQAPAPQAMTGLPAAGTYVLFVSTIEARKNHALLFRVWRRLLDEMPQDRVPTLVFAGRVASLVNDLMQQIVNSDYLDGKLLILDNAGDAELSALYRGCMFTVFPSFYEGWGLPVSESLAFGKPCLISNRSSLPEAGGNLVRSFDPDNLDDAYRSVRNVIDHPAELAAWAEQVRREFKPTPWSAAAAALLAALDAGPANPPAIPHDQYSLAAESLG